MSQRLTKEVFMKRVEDIAAARKIFIPQLTMNITKAYEMYLELMGDKESIRKISRDTKFLRAVEKRVRPLCPECNIPLFIRNVTTPKGLANKYGYKSCWICAVCAYEQYSVKTKEEEFDLLALIEGADELAVNQRIINAYTIKEDLIFPKCPECDHDLDIRAIDAPEIYEIPEHKSTWFCMNCVYEQFNLRGVQQELLLLERKDARTEPSS